MHRQSSGVIDPPFLGPFLGSTCFAAAAIIVVVATNRGTPTRKPHGRLEVSDARGT